MNSTFEYAVINPNLEDVRVYKIECDITNRGLSTLVNVLIVLSVLAFIALLFIVIYFALNRKRKLNEEKKLLFESNLK